MACGVCTRSTRCAASLPGEGSTHLRGCGTTAVGPELTFACAPTRSAFERGADITHLTTSANGGLLP